MRGEDHLKVKLAHALGTKTELQTLERARNKLREESFELHKKIYNNTKEINEARNELMKALDEVEKCTKKK